MNSGIADHSRPARRSEIALPAAALIVSIGTLGWSVFWHTVLTSEPLGTAMFSRGTWRTCLIMLGGKVSPEPDATAVQLDFAPVLLAVLALSLVTWFVGALLIRNRQLYRTRLALWGRAGWSWWWLPGLWECLRIVGFMAGWNSLEHAVLVTPPYWFIVSCGGWLATGTWLALAPFDALSCSDSQSIDSEVTEPLSANRCPAPWLVLLGGVAYCVTFVTMNWQLYENLLVPHGDSAMYEEHLWNVTHGKGFRSYLDQGLFLGEHIQVIHLLLIPLHWLWPSHLLLELCESVALASGALPVFWIARRHTGHRGAATALALAWFLYPPLQFLDIAIDLKTFRPVSFGVPLLLFVIDQMERGRWKTFGLLLLLTLACKEDYAIPLCLLGVWMAVFRGSGWPRRLGGLSVALGSGAYLFWATRVAIPWFRGGAEVHYARYFDARFGESLGEIAWNMLTQPQLLWHELGTLNSLSAVLALLVPLGLLPLASPSRLLVATPTLVLLCLNELSQQPHHHFHAPLVPVLFWSAAAGLPRAGQFLSRIRFLRGTTTWRGSAAVRAALLALYCALLASVMTGISPLSTSFWDPGSLYYWRTLYVVNERARAFAPILESIPPSARVASTDFIHPRFTHHERSYDYSEYRRRVSDYELRVPDDTDYIVIDTGHYYSKIKRPEDVREYREHPERWELLPNDSDGLFLVLKRRDGT